MLFSAALSTIVGKLSGQLNTLTADVFVTVGMLGYKEVSPQAKNGKTCATCKHYKSVTAKIGNCTLPAMKNAMRSASAPKVKAGAYCNMWTQIA